MNNTPNQKVSIVVPCYNYGKYLADCLQSVMGQTYSQWECIIVDNGSTDNTSQVASAFLAKDKRFNYLSTPHSNVSFARNIGISNTSGSFILPLDADDKIHPEYLTEALEIFKHEPSTKIAYCFAEFFENATGRWKLPKYSLQRLLTENVIFCSAIFKRIDYEKTEGFDESFQNGFEDWDFWITMLSNGGEVYCIPKVMFYYRVRSSSRNNKIDAEMQLQLRKQIYTKHKLLYERELPYPELAFQHYITRKELETIMQSKSLALGKAVLKPFLFLNRIFRNR